MAPGCGGDTEAQALFDAGGGEAAAAEDAQSDQGVIGTRCVDGTACGDGGVCAGGNCCGPDSACGSKCCGGGEVCAFQKCVTPGKVCFDSSDCAATEYCDYALGGDGGVAADASCQGGAIQKSGRCLPLPPVCAGDAGAADGGAASCLEKCEYRGGGMFAPELKFAWGGQIAAPHATDVMMTPIVVELDDDDCDGKITERDIPEIVFTTFTGGAYTTNGTVRAISIVKGQIVDKWSRPGEANPSGQLAGGDINGAPGNEIVACAADGTVHAFNGDGTLLWKSPAVLCAIPAIADLDGDGIAEVVVEGGILNGQSGALKAAYSKPLSGRFLVSDLDSDGKLDIVTSSQGYHGDGVQFVDTAVPASYPAIGDFDKDGKPEVVFINSGTHLAGFWRFDAQAAGKFTMIRQGVDINGTLVQHCPVNSAGYTKGGGPPTIADFNGDGTPDVALAGGIGYAIFDGALVMNPAISNPNTLLWAVATTDCSSAVTGSSVFDFDGDGKAEVVYSDEQHLRIYEGPTGKVLWETCNTTGTLIEYPVIADVDNDGHADIVVVSNGYASGNLAYQCNDGKNLAQSGVRVFGDSAGSWVRTRRVWNEHTYHVTNVNEDGTIPANELPNWKQAGLNNFRQNKQPGSEFAAPDAIVAVRPDCGPDYGLVATVTNIGESALPPGVIVGFYAGTPGSGQRIGEGATTQTLYSAQAESVVLLLANPPAGVKEGTTPVYAIVDDTKVAHPAWHECRTDNNVGVGTGACATPN